MAVGVGIGVRKLLLFVRISIAFFLPQASLNISDCVALYMHQKFAFCKANGAIFLRIKRMVVRMD